MLQTGKRRMTWTLLGLLAGGLLVTAQAEDKQQTKARQAKKPAPPAVASDLATATALTAPTKQIFFPPLTKFEKEFQEKLNETVTAEFVDAALSDVITFYQDSTGINFVIFANDLGQDGLTTDEPVNISVENISLKTALDLVLEPIGLTYVLDRDVVKITTRAKAEEMLKTRVYPVGDLCQTPIDYLMLESVIKNTSVGRWRTLKSEVTPSQQAGGGFGGGGGMGGGAGGAGGGFFQVSDQNGMNAVLGASLYHDDEGGTISIVPQSKALVICQTYHAHNAIVELLTQLREARDVN
ncbi:hypothetical protein [Gimesia chilikensis]|uniref:Secretin/TonB short N-terminal domain-containing protein n=1 Tax=Gimesia chilikensis TaxID=2605989 RepID=A0A517PHJ1_9PLAN|nr:hypothetical protein [Gimesia chilikensis]QDT18842.1 hypothetical protein HG66A1_06040 [Gimesia chilikensis]